MRIPSRQGALSENQHRVFAGIMFLGILFLGACSDKATDNAASENTASGRWYTQSQVSQGKLVFQKHCAECHGINAEGTREWRKTLPDGNYPPPPLNGTAHAWHHSLSVLRRSIYNGGIPLGGTMPAFADRLDGREIDAAIAYFQSKWNQEIYEAWLQRGGLK